MNKIISAEELSAHNSRSDLWFSIEGKIYDVTSFVDEHPGGEEVILEQGGLDATEAFIDVGHSDDARKILKDLYIGDLKEGDVIEKPTLSSVNQASMEREESSFLSNFGLPIIFAVLFVIYKNYF
ncbi:hypothetical protein K7432_007881 [Basidiobolus ranarum]|uniref:Cytochrome b5 heme-binding domain-containing protein n=1 Tax=Basidiobolus ranarum TaxID=34480 RepID=A0ABR2VZG2_9FUNG